MRRSTSLFILSTAILLVSAFVPVSFSGRIDVGDVKVSSHLADSLYDDLLQPSYNSSLTSIVIDGDAAMASFASSNMVKAVDRAMILTLSMVTKLDRLI